MLLHFDIVHNGIFRNSDSREYAFTLLFAKFGVVTGCDGKHTSQSEVICCSSKCVEKGILLPTFCGRGPTDSCPIIANINPCICIYYINRNPFNFKFYFIFIICRCSGSTNQYTSMRYSLLTDRRMDGWTAEA